MRPPTAFNVKMYQYSSSFRCFVVLGATDVTNVTFINEIHPVIMHKYVVGSKSFRPDIQKPRQMENAMRDIQGVSRL